MATTRRCRRCENERQVAEFIKGAFVQEAFPYPGVFPEPFRRIVGVKGPQDSQAVPRQSLASSKLGGEIVRITFVYSVEGLYTEIEGVVASLPLLPILHSDDKTRQHAIRDGRVLARCLRPRGTGFVPRFNGSMRAEIFQQN